MRTIEITEANEWKQTLIDVAQSLQDKAAIQGNLSEWDKRVYNEVVEIEKKLDSIEQSEGKTAQQFLFEFGWEGVTHIPYANVLNMMNLFREYRQQPGVTDEEIEEWARTESKLIDWGDDRNLNSKGKNKIINWRKEDLVIGAKAMRDGLIQKK